MASPIRYIIKINGVVQGVGFRPFVYRLAARWGIKGWVKNSPGGVAIEAEGEKVALECFLTGIKEDKPPIARVETVEVTLLSPVGFASFEIKASGGEEPDFTCPSPDIAVCNECLREINDRGDRRFLYPFINCTSCGPRFSIIRGMPYDRPATAMSSFKMCKKCQEEYENPADRRFHAQPAACPDCGPRVWLADKRGVRLETSCSAISAIKKAHNLLSKGKILAVKGLGGFHLACTAREKGVIHKLRERKERSHKPLAIMARDIFTARRYCQIDEDEEVALKGALKPILLLGKGERGFSRLPKNLAPGVNTLGVMLPYTPLHHLLFSGELDILVMTSGNRSGLPIEYTNKGALDRLSGLADFFLLHDREIEVPVDDPVVRITGGEERVIRPGRGYTPQVFPVDTGEDILACGAYYNSTFCLAHRGKAILSQYLGNISTDEALLKYRRTVEHFKRIFNLEPRVIAHDLHPGYLSSDYAVRQPGKKVAVQHHHAHIASCMAENNLRDTVIGLAYDGTGLGVDGHIWGGEFLLCNYRDFTRVGHLNYVPLPGGEKAVLEPWRSALAYLYQTFAGEHDMILKGLTAAGLIRKDTKIILQMLEKGFNSPLTSSMGRLFDAVSALTGIREKVTYQGQAAVELEAAAVDNETGRYSYRFEIVDDCQVINSELIIKGILADLNRGESPGVISRRFHNTIISFSVEVAELIRERSGVVRIVLSGGVFQNRILLEGIRQGLEDRGFTVYTHHRVPCNDGGLSLGQLVIAGGE